MKNLKDICTSLELSKRLYEEGVTQGRGSVFWWTRKVTTPNWVRGTDIPTQSKKDVDYAESHELILGERYGIPRFPALTLHELMEVLPVRPELHYNPLFKQWIATTSLEKEEIHKGCATPLAALESLTIWLLDNKLFPITN